MRFVPFQLGIQFLLSILILDASSTIFQDRNDTLEWKNGCHRFVCFCCMHGYNLRCYVNRLQFSRSLTTPPSHSGQFRNYGALCFTGGVSGQPGNSRHFKPETEAPHVGPTVESGHGGIGLFLSLDPSKPLRGIARKETRKKKEKTRKKRKKKR